MTAPLPVLVGTGQTVDRPTDPELGREPLALMADAARAALEDASAGPAALAAIDTLAVVTNVFHDYGDTARLLAERLGCHPRRPLVTGWGGNTPQSLLNHLCDEIAAGRSELALVVGAEACQTMRALGKLGRTPAWTPPRETSTPRWGDLRDGTHPLENRHGARQPIVTFALVENAFRAARGQSIADEQAEIGRWAASCARIAAANPYAWFRDAKDAGRLMTVAADNRMISFPFPKFVNAIMDVNQGAALLVASEAAADRLRLAPGGRIYPWGGADVHECWYLLERPAIAELPGMRRAARSLLETTEVALDRIDHFDLYSCFPVASRLSAAILGLTPDDPRPLTAAGGLPWFGGPGNDYGTHAIAAVVDRLRTARTGFGLVHALGWNLTKHGLGLYGASPPPRGWQRAGGPDLQAWVDAHPPVEVAEGPSGRGRIEAYTITHGRDGAAERGVVIGRLDDSRRFIAQLPADRDLLLAFEREEGVGRAGTVRRTGEINVFDPV